MKLISSIALSCVIYQLYPSLSSTRHKNDGAVLAFQLSPTSPRSKVLCQGTNNKEDGWSFQSLIQQNRRVQCQQSTQRQQQQQQQHNTHQHPLPTIAVLDAIRHFSAVAVGVATIMFPLIMLPQSMAWADEPTTSTTTSTTTTSSTLVSEQSSSTPQFQPSPTTVVDEVSTLIQKYYIDKSFNGQNWDEVRTSYTQQAKATKSNEELMKLVTEMVKSLGDKYTRVLDNQQYAAIQKFDLIGVGVTLMPNAHKDIIVGAPPIEGSPSSKVGLRAGDFITAVNGNPTKGRTAFDIIDQISEEPDARKVTFSVRRQLDDDLSGEGTAFDVTMERQNFMQVKNPVEYKLSEQRKDGTNVGYIHVSEFNSLVNTKLQDALNDLKSQGANAYVLDLRSNTGGAFQSAVEISGFFFEDKVATYVVDGNQVELPFRSPKGKISVDPEDPLVVWLDGMSASASEVLAGSLHDNCRAVTMGTKSFGKGLIQAVYGLKNGAGLVLTVARYVTPSGTEIQGIGITPDISGSMPPPVIVPVLGSDTSKVDFKEISSRLDPSMCKVPIEHVTTQSSNLL